MPEDFNFKFDRTLKDILKSIPPRFVELLTGRKAVGFLDTNFPKVEELKADLLVRLEDGNVFHLEIQTENDSLMPFRMLKYYLYLYSYYGIEPIQTVLYIGLKPLSMQNGIKDKHISFDYDIKDVKDIDCGELLKSSDLNDNLLSVLCRIDDARSLILELTSRLSKLNKNELDDYKLKLTNILHLRPDLIKVVKELEEKMPITIKLEDDPFYQEGIAEGEAIGEAKGEAIGLSLAKRNYIVNSRKNLNLTPEQIASVIDDTVENVTKVLKEEGL